MDRVDVLTLKKICQARQWTIGTAESCTGGLLAAMITQEPSVSSYFQGSIVSYARAVKINVLKVPLPIILALGEVSLPVAIAMAQGVRRTLGCNWGIAITGIAGPDGGSEEKPIGTVCFGVAGPGFEASVQKHFKSTASAAQIRQDIQRQSANFAFDFLLTAMR